MSARHRFRLVGVAALACAVSVGCGERAPLTIGVVLDADGLRGATMAMEEINARGGINGRPLAFRDVGGAGSTKARLAIETAERLAADPAILAVVGHTNSAASLAASQVYNARHVVQIAPTSSSPLYSDAGPYSFRLVGSDIHQGDFLANALLSRQPRPRTAVMFVNDDYGRPLRNVLVERMRRGGMLAVHDAPYMENSDMLSRTEMTAALARSRPEVLLWLGRSYDYLPIRDLLAKSLPGLVVIASDGFSGREVTNDSLRLLDRVSYVRLVDMQRPYSGLVRLRRLYRDQKWGEPTDQAVLSYDAVLLLSDAIQNAGPEREAIREWLARVGADVPPVAGLSGPIAFLPNGDRKPQYVLEEIGKSRRDSVRSLAEPRDSITWKRD